MSSGEREELESVDDEWSAIPCGACRSALEPESAQSVSFLLLDELTIPVLGCEDHLAEFTEVCGFTTSDTADLLGHHPAGGVQCPGCRNARYDASHPMIAVHDGAVVVTACPDHQSEILQRFQTGLETRQQLTADLGTSNSPL